MAENIVKTIKTERQPKPSKTGLEELPEVKQTSRQPKILKASEQKNKRPRAGTFQPGLNLKGKPIIIEDGKKIK